MHIYWYLLTLFPIYKNTKIYIFKLFKYLSYNINDDVFDYINVNLKLLRCLDTNSKYGIQLVIDKLKRI